MDATLAVDSAPCACDRCEAMCRFAPGWPTVEEAAQLIGAGHGPRLMLDWWNAEDELPYTEVLCPAVVGHEGVDAPEVQGGFLAMLMPTGNSDGGAGESHGTPTIASQARGKPPVETSTSSRRRGSAAQQWTSGSRHPVWGPFERLPPFVTYAVDPGATQRVTEIICTQVIPYLRKVSGL